MFDLVKHADATHVAINDGAWSDPGTWAGGSVPGNGARVLIQEGVHVEYDVVSDARLFTVRVDGHLDFETRSDTKMVVDTMVVDGVGRLTIGTEADPIAEDVTADIVIANNGAIDIGWDPQLLSRGIVSHGAVEIHGQEKTTHLKVSTDPMTGDTSILLDEIPEGWQIGDTLVLAGTHYDGYKYDPAIGAKRHYEPEDEVLTITAIQGNEVFFDTALQYDHDSPRADLKTSVANYTRNITVSTEDPETAAVHERGHVMFMHNDDVDVRYAAFDELGRTDKSEDLDDPISATANVPGRYPFHFHRTGVGADQEEAVAVGNAVWGSPGWGYVHHDSHAVLHDNASYNTFGAGFVSETGNETGSWTDNIAIYAKGVSWGLPKNPGNTNIAGTEFDTAKTGDGFWFQSRMVEASGNVAASVNYGFVYFHRGDDKSG
ncbi:MAG: G8 domain-containing protein, partial [Planctomycetota bacterium]